MTVKHLACALALALASCAHASQTAQTASPAPSIFYPPGIVPPADSVAQKRSGIYPGATARECCFLAGRSLFTLDNPAGSVRVVFTFYVPSVKPLTAKPERVALALNGVSAGPPAVLHPGLQEVIFAVPPALRGRARLGAALTMSTVWIPQRIGLNDDVRELSVVLVKAGYI